MLPLTETGEKAKFGGAKFGGMNFKFSFGQGKLALTINRILDI